MLATNRPRRFAHTLYSLLLVTCFQISDTYAPCTAIVPSTRSALATWHRSRHARAALAAPSTWRGTLETGKVDDKQDFTVAVSTVMGVEGVVKQELSALGYDGYPVGASGRVELTGGSKAIIDCNLHLRSATRVMLVLAQFTATTFDELFDGTAAIHWADYIHRGAAFPVRGKSVKSTLTSVPACQSIVKKAIITKLLSADPSRAAANAEGWLQEDARTGLCGVEVSIQKDEVTISLDTSGDALHRRGYRSGVLQGGAPLKETLAASMLMISDWTPDRPLLDPFCGSGTILLEAALMAHKMPPGLRRSFAAEKWPLVCPPGEWERARQEAQAQVVLSPPARIYGADIDRRAVEMTYQHLQAAGLDKTVQLSVSDVHDLPPPPGAYGCVVTNPPYGERLGGAASANEGIGRLMRQLHDRHWSLFALSGDMEFEAHVGRTSDKRRKLYNGKLPCQLFHYVSAPPPRPRAPRRSKPGLSPPASGKTGEAAPGVRDAQQKEGRAGDWHCPRCKTYVFGSKASCLKCGYEKRNDWACPSCQSLVFASKLACFKCGTHRAPEGPGSRGGGKPKGGAGSGHGAGGGLGKGGGRGGRGPPCARARRSEESRRQRGGRAHLTGWACFATGCAVESADWVCVGWQRCGAAGSSMLYSMLPTLA